jgi:hypothetical protein
LWVLCGILSSAYRQSNVLPTPFPLCPMNGKTSRIGGQVDGFYSLVSADTNDLECTGIVVMGVKENPDPGKPSYHVLLDGAIVQSKDNPKTPTYVKESGYVLGASVAPSFVLTDRIQGFRPSLFFGADVRYQKLDIELVVDSTTSININSSDFIQMGGSSSLHYYGKRRGS